MACNREDLAVPSQPDDIPAVNEATKGTIPVHLRIGGNYITTKGTSPNENESDRKSVV